MKKELYKRIKIKMVPGDDDLKNDALVEAKINNEIEAWLRNIQLSHPDHNTEYRITNVEHAYLPAPAMSPGNPVVYIVVNIAYSI